MESLQVALRHPYLPKPYWHQRQPWQQLHPAIHLSSWVDDVGFDTASRTPLQAAQASVAAYRDLHARLLQLGLQVNPKKAAFVATDKATEKELRSLLREDDPQVTPVEEFRS